MTESRWLKREWVDLLHARQVLRFGGLPGVRDEAALESALARARNRWEYAEERELLVLAAAYGYGFARNHGYTDGNKRMGFMVLAVFLGLNGWSLDAPEPEVVRVMQGVAAGSISEEELADWLRGYAHASVHTGKE